ncbi:MAG: hypothetical protein ACRDN9_08825 [Streptosporangiaceae bacterium]
MYVWIWRHLPGGRFAKSVSAVILIAVALALLYVLVFPWAEAHLPFQHVTVRDTGQ